MPFVTAMEGAGLRRSSRVDGAADGAADGLATIRLAGNNTCPATQHRIMAGQPQHLAPLRGEAAKARFPNDALAQLGDSPAPFSDLESQACRTVVMRVQQEKRRPDMYGMAGPDTFGALGYGCAASRGFTPMNLSPGRIRWND